MKLLSLDLSTSSTGYAIFETDRKLEDTLTSQFGVLKPKVEGLSKLTYPEAALKRCQSLAEQIHNLILEHKPDKIVAEEVNRGISRLGQKVLDGLHFIILDRIEKHIPILEFMDSDGKSGWRSANCLNLKLSKNDKTTNARRRKRNVETRKAAKKAGKRVTPGTIFPVINKKHKAAEFVNSLFELELDVDKTSSDADIGDAIGLGVAYMIYVLKTHSK